MQCFGTALLLFHIWATAIIMDEHQYFVIVELNRQSQRVLHYALSVQVFATNTNLVGTRLERD